MLNILQMYQYIYTPKRRSWVLGTQQLVLRCRPNKMNYIYIYQYIPNNWVLRTHVSAVVCEIKSSVFDFHVGVYEYSINT